MARRPHIPGPLAGRHRRWHSGAHRPVAADALATQPGHRGAGEEESGAGAFGEFPASDGRRRSAAHQAVDGGRRACVRRVGEQRLALADAGEGDGRPDTELLVFGARCREDFQCVLDDGQGGGETAAGVAGRGEHEDQLYDADAGAIQCGWGGRRRADELDEGGVEGGRGFHDGGVFFEFAAAVDNVGTCAGH